MGASDDCSGGMDPGRGPARGASLPKSPMSPESSTGAASMPSSAGAEAPESPTGSSGTEWDSGCSSKEDS